MVIMEIPKEIRDVAKTLRGAGFEAYLVGGSVRDILLNKKPKDWDIATNAKPEEIQRLFKESVYENQFGTVGVKTESENPDLKIVEVTTFRIEGKYTDKRHPDEIKFANAIEDDLARRDFTINAIALRCDTKESQIHANEANVVDPFNGQADLKNKYVRAVGNPKERFNEDALRLMRAVRLSAELGFEIEKDTAYAIRSDAGLLEMIAKDRIRDEFIKTLVSDRAAAGVVAFEDYNLLRFVLPELREGIGCGQNLHHIYTVFDHNVRALNYTVEKNYPLHIRLAALLHDIGKPRTKRGEGEYSTFHGHEVVGARMVIKTLDRLHFSKELVLSVAHLVRSHMFYYNVDEVSAAGVRRFLRRVGPENVDDLIKIREADRVGSGVPKAKPYKIRHLLFMIEKVRHDPVGPGMLEVDGNDIMKFLKIEPGPRVGRILAILLEEVLDDPKKNNKKSLEGRIKELGDIKDEELEVLSEKARERKEEFEGGIERDMKEKHHVK